MARSRVVLWIQCDTSQQQRKLAAAVVVTFFRDHTCKHACPVCPPTSFNTNIPLKQVWDKALECRLDRGVTFLALGGGVIGDMTGFAAAAYQRGVYFVQVRAVGSCVVKCISHAGKQASKQPKI